MVFHGCSCNGDDESSIITSEQGQEADSAVPNQQSPFAFLVVCQALILQPLGCMLPQSRLLHTAQPLPTPGSFST